MRRSIHAAIVIMATTMGGLLLAETAAGKSAVFSVTPPTRAPYFIFNSTPGSVIHGQVRVVNVSSSAGQARLYAVDATTGQTSGAVYLSPGAPRRQVGSWIKLNTGTVVLGPHHVAQVPFSVAVPTGEQPGQYLGGIVVAPSNPVRTTATRRGKSTFHVNIQEISVVAVQVNLPGPLVYRLAINGISASGRPGYQTLLMNLANTGNALVKGQGTIEVSRAGQRVLAQKFALDTMVPRTSISYPVYVRGARLPPGRYAANVTLAYTGGHSAHSTFAFSISRSQVRQTYGTTVPQNGLPPQGSSSVPVWAIGLGALALVGVSIGGSALFFRRRSKKESQTAP